MEDCSKADLTDNVIDAAPAPVYFDNQLDIGDLNLPDLCFMVKKILSGKVVGWV